MTKIKKEIGYTCSRGSNHMDFYDVHECVCGSKANGRVYVEFSEHVTEAEATTIVENAVNELNDWQKAWDTQQAGF